MTTSQDNPPDLPTPPADWIPLARYNSLHAAEDHALVLIATNHECWLHQENDNFQIYIPPSTESSARNEISAYENENVIPPPTPHDISPFRYQATWTIHLWLASLIFCYTAQTIEPSLTNRGLSSSLALFLHHEWWRPFTALFLHADFPHLLGNLLGAALFGSFVVRTAGPLLGITAILASGTLGNTLNALFHFPDLHQSLGASTAVFGALGILAALGTLELLHHPRKLPWRSIIGPLLAGLILLGWMGGGSPSSLTDVGAHIAGFLSGIALGSSITLLSPPHQQPTPPSPYLK